MWQLLTKFAQQVNLPLSPTQAQVLESYAKLVWQKKDFLNLTSASTLEEILNRHICDGLQGASCVLKYAKKLDKFSLIDAGSGAGYIGLTIAIALPQAQVTLVESLEKRCAFLNWAILNLGLKNVQVNSTRLGEKKELQAHFVTERAMGKLPNILGICLRAVQPGGIFIAYQGENSQASTVQAPKYEAQFLLETNYMLPSDNKTRHLALFSKDDK